MTATRSYYDIQQAARPVAPTVERVVVYKIRPQLVSVTCQLEPGHGEREAFFCTISKEALLALPGLKAGSRVNLIVPTNQRGHWYLDTQPRPGDGYELPKGRAYFRLRPISRQRFGVRGHEKPFGATAAPRRTLTLRFVLSQQERPGLYRLQPVVEKVAEASRRAGHQPVPMPVEEARREAKRLAASARRTRLREQVAAGLSQAIAHCRAERQRQTQRQRLRRQMKRSLVP